MLNCALHSSALSGLKEGVILHKGLTKNYDLMTMGVLNGHNAFGVPQWVVGCFVI